MPTWRANPEVLTITCGKLMGMLGLSSRKLPIILVFLVTAAVLAQDAISLEERIARVLAAPDAAARAALFAEGSRTELLTALHKSGHDFSKSSESAKAVAAYRAAVELADLLGDAKASAADRYQLAFALSAIKQLDDALALLDEAGRRFGDLQDGREVTRVLTTHSELLTSQRRYAEAEPYAARAIESAISIQDQALEARAESSSGDVYLGWARYDNAILHFKKALAISENCMMRLMSRRLRPSSPRPIFISRIIPWPGALESRVSS